MTSATAGGLPARRLLLALVGLGVSAAAVWLVVRDVDLARTAVILGRAQPLVLVVAIGVVGGQALVRSARWQRLLPLRADGSPIPVSRVLPVMLVGYLGNAVMPARLGEVLRSALVARRESIPAPEAFGSVVLERIIDVLVLGALGITAAAAVAAPAWMLGVAIAGTLVAGIGVAAAGIAGFASRRRPLLGRYGSTGRLLAPLRRIAAQAAAGARVVDRPAAVAAAAALTLVAWLLDATVFWLVALSLGLELSPAAAMLVSAVAVLSTAIPTAPGYVGTFHLAAVAAVAAAGIAGEAALAFAVLAHLIALLPLAVAGAASLWAVGGPSVRHLAAAPRLPSATC